MKNSMKTPDQKKRSKQLGKEIRDNMNLCRKHVIYLRSRVETDLDPEYYPDEYGLEIPEEVDNNYMADPDGIRSRTKDLTIIIWKWTMISRT